jgi:hypothetical protein
MSELEEPKEKVRELKAACHGPLLLLLSFGGFDWKIWRV